MSKHTARDHLNTLDNRPVEVERRIVAAALLGADIRQISQWEWAYRTPKNVRDVLEMHGILIERGRIGSKQYDYTYTLHAKSRAYLQLPDDIPITGARRELTRAGAVVDSEAYHRVRGIFGDERRTHMLPEWQAPTMPADEWEWRVD